MSDDDREPDFFSNVPISTPLVQPDDEIVTMNGFAWTNQGFRVATGRAGDKLVDALRSLRERRQ